MYNSSTEQQLKATRLQYQSNSNNKYPAHNIQMLFSFNFNHNLGVMKKNESMSLLYPLFFEMDQHSK